MAGSLSTSNSKIYLAYKLVLFIVILLVLDFIGGSLLKYLYFSQQSGDDYSLNYAMDKANEDILLLGDSRIHHGCIPEIFTDILGYSSYNAARGAQSIIFSYAVLSAILKRHNPKIVIVDMPPNGLAKRSNGYDKLSCLLPYYRSHPEIRRFVDLRGSFEKFKLISRVYPFNSTILKSLKERHKPKKDWKGYVPRHKVVRPDIDVANQPADMEGKIIADLDPNLVEAYTGIITKSIEVGAKPFVVILPRYKYPRAELDYKLKSYKVIKKIAADYNVPFWDMSFDTLFYGHNEYFSDMSHFNHKGAQLFSKVLAEKIKAELGDSIVSGNTIVDKSLPDSLSQ